MDIQQFGSHFGTLFKAIGFFFTRLDFFFFLLVRDISFPKVLVRVLLGFSQIQKVLVFQLNGFREFLRNYSVEVTRSKKSTRYQFTGFVRVFHQLHGLHFFPFFCGPISISKNHMLLCFSFWKVFFKVLDLPFYSLYSLNHVLQSF